jgi:hypothetical protein
MATKPLEECSRRRGCEQGVMAEIIGSCRQEHEKWLQGNRQMTATNVILPGMTNEEKSATLVAVAEAVEWKHGFEPVGLKRQGQRVVIYPRSWTSFDNRRLEL